MFLTLYDQCFELGVGKDSHFGVLGEQAFGFVLSFLESVFQELDVGAGCFRI